MSVGLLQNDAAMLRVHEMFSAIGGGSASGGGGLRGKAAGKRRLAPALKGSKLVQAFNTWAFKREQPSDLDAIVKLADAAIAAAAPLEFVLYWGKGPRSAIAAPDLECLDYLASMTARVRDLHAPGALMRIICTDTHARLNGHAHEAIEAYFAAVRDAASVRGFETCRLADLVADAAAMTGDVASEPSPDVLRSLVVSAQKWYRGDGSSEDGALDYYRLNMVERRAVEIAFPQAIFVTFNGSDFRDLFPASMPIFYMYSLRRGFGVKPWFLTADAASATVAA